VVPLAGACMCDQVGVVSKTGLEWGLVQLAGEGRTAGGGGPGWCNYGISVDGGGRGGCLGLGLGVACRTGTYSRIFVLTLYRQAEGVTLSSGLQSTQSRSQSACHTWNFSIKGHGS